MQQSELWIETIFDALGSAVKSAGGAKQVAKALWPALDELTARSRLRGGINAEHSQKLCVEEIILLAKHAKAAGDNSIMEFLARELGYEIKSLTPAEAKKRSRKQRINALLAEASRLSQEDD